MKNEKCKTFSDPILTSVGRLRKSYEAVCQALPWLDMSVWPDDPPAFGGQPPAPPGESVRTVMLERGLRGRLTELKAKQNIRLARYSSGAGSLEDVLTDFSGELAQARLPLVVLHTDVTWAQLEKCAARYSGVDFIIESGPIKILYHIQPISELMQRRPNVWLCLANLCNWLGLERLMEQGLGGRLLFGTHRPRFNPHAVMGLIAMSRLSWEQKCDLAGNNLRRLLDQPARRAPDTVFERPAPFIIDAHTHCGINGRFPVPDEKFAPSDWLSAMDAFSLQTLLICPSEALSLDPKLNPRDVCGPLLACARGRVRYFEVFNPRVGAAKQQQRLENAAGDPDCCGIKIHPSEHRTAADDQAYAPVYEWASAHRLPVLTHSWDISATNPVQELSFPSRFRKHLLAHPGVRLVLGHAGGRPGSLAAVVALCREFPAVRVDLAGDYYDAGLIEQLAAHVGTERIIFGSDLNWIDPRANLGPVLASSLTDPAVASILQGNALTTYGRGHPTR